MPNGFFKEKIRMINNRGKAKGASESFLRQQVGCNDDGRSGNKIRAGFILLFALLVSSVILTAGLAVSRIIIRQIYLASVQRDSQIALFAADTGLECGRYWREFLETDPTRTCNGGLLTITGDLLSLVDPSSFWFNLGANNIPKTCVKVSIVNTLVGSVPTQMTQRKITARGYNVECDSTTGNPVGGRVVERKLVYTYSE